MCWGGTGEGWHWETWGSSTWTWDFPSRATPSDQQMTPIVSNCVNLRSSQITGPCCYPFPKPRVMLAALKASEKDEDHKTMSKGRSSATCWSCCGMSNVDSAAPSSSNTSSRYLFSYLSELNQSPLRSMEFSHWRPWVLDSVSRDESVRNRQEITHEEICFNHLLLWQMLWKWLCAV